MKKLVLFLALAVSLAAEPVILNNAEAARLFAALRTINGGITAINTRNAALDVNTIRPVVEAFESGQRSLNERAQKIAPTDPLRDAKIQAINKEADDLIHAKNTIDLTLFALTDDEIKDAKISTDALAEMLRFLAPPVVAPKQK